MKYKYIVAALVLTAVTPAYAQDMYFTDFTSMGIDRSNSMYEYSASNYRLENGGSGENSHSGDEGNFKGNSPAEEVSVNDLKYSPSPSLRRANMSKFARSMKKSNPAKASEIDKIFSNGQIIDQLDQMMRPMGLRADNTADAYALWWVAAWHAVNMQQLNPDNKVLAAVKQQASNALLTTPELASVSDSQKQEFAESLLIQTMLIDTYIDGTAGNPAQQAELSKAVNQGAKKMGLDLTMMELTENGFVPRSGKRSDASDIIDGANSGEARAAWAANNDAASSDTGKLALYGVGGVALLAGMFALGKSFGGKG